MNYVVSDVGGTNARFAYAAGPDSPLTDILVMKCADFATIEDALAAYRQQINLDDRLNGAGLDAVAVAVAAPVNGPQVKLTNNHWQFEKAALRTAVSANRLLVINDFTAQALAQSDPTAHGNQQLLGGRPKDDATLLVIGPGTGLGVSALVPTSIGPLAIEGEGGHVSFSPRSRREMDLYEFANAKFGHVTAEHFVSGAGLETIYAFLAKDLASAAILTAPEIGEAAIAEDGLCREAALMMLDILGTVIADNTLLLGAWRGTVIAGGVVPRLAALVPASDFADRIRSIGAASPLMANLPVWLCVDPYAGLRGALVGLGSAHLAPQALTG